MRSHLCFSFSLGILTLATALMPSLALGQSSAGSIGCYESGLTAECTPRSSTSSVPRSNPFAAAYNAIQQNLQNENKTIQNATNQVLNYIQQSQNNNSNSYSNSAPPPTYNADNSNDSPEATFDNAAPPPQPDPVEARNEAAAELISESDSVLDSSTVPGAPATPAGSGDTSVANSVSNVLGDSGSDSGVAQDVSDVLGGSSTDSTVAGDVSNVLGDAGSGASPATNPSGTPVNTDANATIAADVSGILGDNSSSTTISAGTAAVVVPFAAAESDLSVDSQTSTAATAAQIQDADTEVMEVNTAQSAPSNDETTQQVESAMSQDENSPSLGGWLEENLNYVQDGLSYAQQKARDAVADSTSDDPVTQKVNEIYYAANPLTGLGPAMAAAGGNVPAGLYNYLDTIVNKSGQLFGLIVNPDADQ